MHFFSILQNKFPPNLLNCWFFYLTTFRKKYLWFYHGWRTNINYFHILFALFCSFLRIMFFSRNFFRKIFFSQKFLLAKISSLKVSIYSPFGRFIIQKVILFFTVDTRQMAAIAHTVFFSIFPILFGVWYEVSVRPIIKELVFIASSDVKFTNVVVLVEASNIVPCRTATPICVHTIFVATSIVGFSFWPWQINDKTTIWPHIWSLFFSVFQTDVRCL